MERKIAQVFLYSKTDTTEEIVNKYYDKKDSIHYEIKESVLKEFRNEDGTYDLDKIPEDLKALCICNGLSENNDIQKILFKFYSDENFIKMSYYNPFKVYTDDILNLCEGKNVAIEKINKLSDLIIKHEIIEEKDVYTPELSEVKVNAMINISKSDAINLLNEFDFDYINIC